MPEEVTFKPPPETRNTGIFAPGYGKKDNPKILLGSKPNDKPVSLKGTKTQTKFIAP
tara:strand:- start:780 stop:950 length:171 start_codon:yes stop_codon:yes gene_type:complete